jgi:hypothetical protein
MDNASCDSFNLKREVNFRKQNKWRLTSYSPIKMKAKPVNKEIALGIRDLF